jgi:TrmH family RNA methyltransferase
MSGLHVLKKLHGMARLRKCCVLLEKAERELAVLDCADDALSSIKEIGQFLLGAEESSADVKTLSKRFLDSVEDTESSLRALNDFRHSLRHISGQSSADWDLIDPAIYARYNSLDSLASRYAKIPRFPGLILFLEDIRSPFNIGTIFRTAEALGFGEILLSPNCASPKHPRALRSSMGAVEHISWRHCNLDELSSMGRILALELGGTPLLSFDFPETGIMIVGSEELGVSSRALEMAGTNRISIPMFGVKASLNVAVALGIAAHAWVAHILPDNPQAQH